MPCNFFYIGIKSKSRGGTARTYDYCCCKKSKYLFRLNELAAGVVAFPVGRGKLGDPDEKFVFDIG